MKIIFYKELQELIKDNRFFLMLIIVILYGVSSGFISSANYEMLNKQYNHISEKYQEELEKNSKISLQNVIFNVRHIAMLKPQPNIFLIGNTTLEYPNYSEIIIPNLLFIDDIDAFLPKNEINNEIDLFGFFKFDTVFIINLILSLMTILLLYNTISKEKELGTLKVILSNNIKKNAIILGKVSAYLLVIISTILLLMLIQIISVIIIGKIPITFSVIKTAGTIFLCSIFYTLFWILTCIVISTLAKRSTISLCYLLVLWLFVVIIIPSTVNITLTKFQNKIPSSDQKNKTYNTILEEMWAESANKNAGYRGDNIYYNAMNDHLQERNFAPIYMKYLNKLNNYQYNIAQENVRELENLYLFSSISPSFLYSNMCEYYTNSGLSMHYKFIDLIQSFRQQLINFCIQTDNKDNKSLHLKFLPNYLSQKSVETSIIPRFSNEIKTQDSINTKQHFCLVLYAIILLFTALVVSFKLFQKFDPR